MKSFFVLDTRGGARVEGWPYSDFMPADPYRTGDEAPRCEECGEYVDGLPWLPPFRVELAIWERVFGDLVPGTGTSFLISQRFKALIEEHRLRGLEGFEPVEIVCVKRRRRFTGNPPPYFRVTALRSQAAIDQTASGFDWQKPPICQACRLGRIVMRWKRIILEEGTWAGEDFFVARGLMGEILVSERVKRVVDENKLMNVFLVPAEEYGHDFYPLRSEAEEQRVHEVLAMPLGPMVLQKVLRGNGRTWKYSVLTNELLVIAPDGKVETYMKPEKGIEFFNLDL